MRKAVWVSLLLFTKWLKQQNGKTPNRLLLEKGDEIIDMGDDFDFEGFQVVRREFFAHLTEPAVTFNNCRFYVNSACLNKFPDTDYVQVLVNRSTKILALRPCQENARDSFAWCSATKGKKEAEADHLQIVLCQDRFDDGVESRLSVQAAWETDPCERAVHDRL